MLDTLEDLTLVMPEVGTIRRNGAIANQVAYVVPVTYPGEDTTKVTFIGSPYGTPGPVLMMTPGLGSTWVLDAGRFGPEFGIAWIHKFFGSF